MADTAPPRFGVLLINVGTPDAPTPAAIRRFLGEFLSDPYVVDLPAVLWQPLLRGVILPLRARRLAAQYRRIWRHDGSPLRAITRELRQGLELRLSRELGEPVAVQKAMRYGQPDIAATLAKLQQAALKRLVVLPLYPQYSRTTTATALDAVERWFEHSLWRPELRIIKSYHTDLRYVAALADSVLSHWSAAGRGQRLVISFHGIPQRYADRGDPYGQQCRETALGLAEALRLRDDEWTLAYQSRVGGARWLQPYTTEVLLGLARDGVRRVDVIAPGFAADCLETLDEIVIRYQGLFVGAGGEALRYVPALNARTEHVEALAQLCAARLAA